jgi:hypothetical protein
MRKEILVQRYTFAEIHPYKDYCKLSEKPKERGLNTFVSSLDYGNESIDNIFKPSYDTYRLELESKSEMRRKNTKFFYSDESVGVNVQLNGYFKKGGAYFTQNDRQIKQHFGRAFSSMETFVYERSIIQDGDKLTIKLSTYSKKRFVNCKYFKKVSTINGICLNLKTGDITTFEKAFNSKVMRARKNTFSNLMMSLESSLTWFGERAENFITNQDFENTKRLKKEIREEFDNKVFYRTLYHFFNTFQNHKTNEPNWDSKVGCREWLYDNLIDLFVIIKGIKTPDHYRRLISICYPTKPFLKKNENKLVAAILDRLGLKSKQTIKLLHKNPNADIRSMFRLKRYFGESIFKYLSNIDSSIFNDTLPKQISPYGNNFYNEKVTYENTFDLNDTEKYNLIKLFNEFAVSNKDNHRMESVLNNQLNQIDDHLHMVKKLRDYYPDMMLRAKNWQEFHNEHLELSRLERLIKRGSVIEYVFDEKLISMIEEPIKVWELDGIYPSMEKYRMYYPVLLKQEMEYSEEGSHMHHCVASYSNKELSIIVSLRADSTVGSERVTNEFDVRDKICTQSRYFCNQAPPEHFEDALDALKRRIGKYKYSIKSIEKRVIPLTINGIDVTQKKIDTTDVPALF